PPSTPTYFPYTTLFRSREYRERELQAENHLAEDQKLGRAVRAKEDSRQRRGHNRDETCDQAAQPRANANVEESFHHDLAGQCPRDRKSTRLNSSHLVIS